MLIYLWTHKNKGYIGKWQGDEKSLLLRYHKEIKKKADRYVINAMIKYGIASFNFKVLEKCKTTKQLAMRERHWIKKMNTLSPYGYNLTAGGDGLLNPSKETREKMRNAKLGKPPANKGIPCSKEKKEKLRKANLGKIPSKSTRKKTSKKISLLWKDPEFRARNIKAKFESWKRRKHVKSYVRS